MIKQAKAQRDLNLDAASYRHFFPMIKDLTYDDSVRYLFGETEITRVFESLDEEAAANAFGLSESTIDYFYDGWLDEMEVLFEEGQGPDSPKTQSHIKKAIMDLDLKYSSVVIWAPYIVQMPEIAADIKDDYGTDFLNFLIAALSLESRKANFRILNRTIKCFSYLESMFQKGIDSKSPQTKAGIKALMDINIFRTLIENRDSDKVISYFEETMPDKPDTFYTFLGTAIKFYLNERGNDEAHQS